MRRIVLDPGVFVSALINPGGAPGRLLSEIRAGAMEMIVSSLLLEELERVLRRDKFRRYVDLGGALEYLSLVRRNATFVPDPGHRTPLHSSDPDDDYLIALAHGWSAILVSGDKHLIDLAGNGAPILSPADSLAAFA